jgi:hypothetical protein
MHVRARADLPWQPAAAVPLTVTQILTVIFNVIWIGATLDVEVKPAAPPAGDDARLS